MQNQSETKLKHLNSQKKSNQGSNSWQIKKNKKVRREISKEQALPKRQYKKNNRQIHIHSICVALKNGSTLTIERIETQVVDESKKRSKKNQNQLDQIITKRDQQALKNIIKEQKPFKMDCRSQSLQIVAHQSGWNWQNAKNSGLNDVCFAESGHNPNEFIWPTPAYVTNYQNYMPCMNWMSPTV